MYLLKVSGSNQNTKIRCVAVELLQWIETSLKSILSQYKILGIDLTKDEQDLYTEN
jgi:hypothetical protein